MKKTALYNRLTDLGGKMVEYAGFFMPVQFAGIISEHNAVRNTVGLFDVSHMARFILEGGDVLSELNYIFTNDFTDLPVGRIRYTLMCNDKGGVIDDLLVYNLDGNRYLLVVNACNAQKDKDRINSRLQHFSCLTDISGGTTMIAVQGRNAKPLMEEVFGAIPERFYSFIKADYITDSLKCSSTVTASFCDKAPEPTVLCTAAGTQKNVSESFSSKIYSSQLQTSKCIGNVMISRTGYTGENGYEIILPNDIAIDFFDRLYALKDKYALSLCGLGARDTLRLEAGMPLYGHEMSEDIPANEIGLDNYIVMNKDFIGREALLNHTPKYLRTGIKLLERGIAREGAVLYNNGEEVGYVTSGTLSVTLGYPIAVVRIKTDTPADNLVDIRGRQVRCEVTPLPFYKRG
jgi:aminomethyltransferase